tara:strand:+ start:1307 stop:1648 length:342 start_codon:yes stop_codon:yes gene_type:complete
MTYKEHIINYAIDNKVSLEEAYRRFVVQQDIKPKTEPESFDELEALPPGYDDEVMTPEEGKAWARYQEIQKELTRLYDEYSTAGEDYIKNNVSDEDLEWVEEQLKDIDEIELW